MMGNESTSNSEVDVFGYHQFKIKQFPSRERNAKYFNLLGLIIFWEINNVRKPSIISVYYSVQGQCAYIENVVKSYPFFCLFRK